MPIDNPEDPLDLDAVDRAIRINELTEQLKELGGPPPSVSQDCPPAIHEGFLESILAFESAPLGTRFDQLADAGVELPPPDSLDDESLSAALGTAIGALADHDVFLSNTDHLSDRELYEYLWTDGLREVVQIMPPGSGWNCHIDPIGSGSEQDQQLWLRYYADDRDREHWASDFPADDLPPSEKPPYDRDRLLPKAEPPRCAEEQVDECQSDDESDDQR